MKRYFCVGTYTEPILFGTGEIFHGKGEGIYLCCYDGEKIEVLDILPLVNPSFLCVDEEKRKIYAVGEAKEWQGKFGGSVSEISYDDDGRMRLENTYGTDGTDPCHVAVSPDKRWLAVANFASGAVTVFPLDEKGSIIPQRMLFQHRGKGADSARQKGPHAHSVIFRQDGRMLVPDLGLDTVVGYCYGKDKVWREKLLDVHVAAGSGPRYGEFSADGRHLYLINEIACMVMHFTDNDGVMVLQDEISTLSEGFDGENISADLHLTPDGQFLYASNRGHDSLAIFKVEADGGLTRLGHQACGGRTPRNFAIDPDGKFLMVGNQDSDNITAYAIGEDGRLWQTGDFSFPTPVCIRFFRKELE